MEGCGIGWTKNRITFVTATASTVVAPAVLRLWGIVATEKQKVLTGEVRTVKHADRVRSFAACCGTSLFFQDNDSAPSIDVAIATLDDPEPHAPDRSIWVEDHISWVALDPDRKALQMNKEE